MERGLRCCGFDVDAVALRAVSHPRRACGGRDDPQAGNSRPLAEADQVTNARNHNQSIGVSCIRILPYSRLTSVGCPAGLWSEICVADTGLFGGVGEDP